MKNNMKEVAKLLNVEFNEWFIVIEPTSSCWTYAKIKEDGFYTWESKIDGIVYWKPSLEKILKGDYIIKDRESIYKPYKPKFNERYYSIGVDGSVEDGTWLNDFLDYTLYKIGNCYRTVDEARANRIKWGTFYDSDEVLTL